METEDCLEVALKQQKLLQDQARTSQRCASEITEHLDREVALTASLQKDKTRLSKELSELKVKRILNSYLFGIYLV